MNGLSFPNNRWAFIYSFVLAYIVTLTFDFKLTKKELRNVFIFFAMYSLISIIAVLTLSASAKFVIFLIQILIAFIILLVVSYESSKENSSNIEDKKKFNYKNIAVVYALVILSIGIMAYGLYSSYDQKYAKEFIKLGKAEETIATQVGKNKNYEQNIKNILENDKGFYRISKTMHSIYNLSMYYNYHSNENFLSIGNKYVYNLSKEIGDAKFPSYMEGWGDRAKITTLLGTKYYITDEKGESNIPYGYTLSEDIDGVKTYENKFALSLGVVYSEYLLREEYEKLNPLEKEDAILKVAVIDNKEDLKGLNINKKETIEDIKNDINEIPYEIEDKNNIIQGNKIVITKKNQNIKLKVENIENSELYVLITGFEFNGNSKHSVTAKFNNKVITKTTENKITSAYYSKMSELLFPFGYYEKTEGKIDISFSTKGEYKFDTIEVIAVPMTLYGQNVKNLQENEMNEIRYNNKAVIGKVNLSKDSILQISTGYTIGWNAYIDGKKVDTIKVNTAFIGIPVSAGEHEVALKYSVPYLNMGIGFSIIGIILFILLAILEKRQNRYSK